MSWPALLVLAAAAYGLKALGPVFAGGQNASGDLREALDLVAVPVLAGLIAVQTLDAGGRLAVDVRLIALGVAALLVWRRAPFLVVVLAAAGCAALLRALAA